MNKFFFRCFANIGQDVTIYDVPAGNILGSKTISYLATHSRSKDAEVWIAFCARMTYYAWRMR